MQKIKIGIVWVLFKNKKINVIITVVITKKNGIKCLKKKKNKGSVVQGRNAIFVFKLFQIFCGDKTQKRKSKKIKKKGGRNNFIFGSKNNIRRYRKLRGDENRKLKTQKNRKQIFFFLVETQKIGFLEMFIVHTFKHKINHYQ